VARSFLFVSSFKPQEARLAVQASLREFNLAVVSPSDRAHETAGYAVGGRWISIMEEPLLASRAFAESGADVLSRLAQAMRGLAALTARTPLVVLDGLDVLGAAAFTLDEAGLMRCADDLERLVPQP